MVLFPGRGETQKLGLGVRGLGTVRQPRGTPGKAWRSGQAGRSACGPRPRLLGPVRSLREGVGDGKDEVVSSPWRASVTQGLAGEAVWRRGGGAAGRRRSPRGCSEGQRKLRGEGAGVVAADREAGRESPVSAAHGHRCASEPRLLPRHVCWNLLEAPNHPALLTVRSTQRGILPCAKTLFFVVLEPFSPRDTLGMQLQCLSGSGTS